MITGEEFLAILFSPKIAKSIMITQQEFVADCYLDYAARGLEPGNPEHGEWHKAHYPVPECLKGTEWIWLLEEHHAIQGILQSAEYNHRCFYGYWEEKYLTGEWEYLRETYDFWVNQKEREFVEKANEHYRNNPGKRTLVTSLAGTAAMEMFRNNPHKLEDRTNKVREGNKKFRKNNPNKAKEISRKGAAAMHAIKVQCTITGKISTPGGLSHWQRARGIDTSNRVRLN